MAKKKKEISDPSEINVKLKKIAGFSPRIYVPAIYITAIVLIFYIVFLHPGISRGGTLLTLNTLPSSAIVFVDGTRQESTPTPFYVLKGERTFTITKPGFKTEEFTQSVKGRIFGSRFFPRKETLYINLELEDPELIMETAYEDWARWIQTGEPQMFYPVPQVMTPAAEGLFRGSQGLNKTEFTSLLSASFQHSNHPVMVKDLMKGLFISEAGGSVLTIDSLSSVVAEVSQYLSDNPNAAYLLAGSASLADTPEKLKNQLQDKVKPATAKELTPVETDTSVRIMGNLRFIEIPGGSFIMGSDESEQFPHIETYKTYYIQETEVSQTLFNEYLTDTGRTLEGFIFQEENAKLPMNGINYEDAENFTKWFSERYCEKRGYKAVIPNEIQWERAAKLNFDYSAIEDQKRELLPVDSGPAGIIGLKFIDGNLWEWTRDDYRPLSHFFNKRTDHFESGIKTVKGGCYVNAPDGISPSIRGSQPSDFRTPFLGLRMALERIK